MKKIFGNLFMCSIFLVAVVLMFPSDSKASVVEISDLREGDLISASGSDDPDVYIINDMGYKRLILNPEIFSFYGHLGGFENVKSVSEVTRDAYKTSGLFRNCDNDDQRVYGLVVDGEDSGELGWVNISGSQAVAEDDNFFKKVFCINTLEFNSYNKSSTTFSSALDVPDYSRADLPVVVETTPTPTFIFCPADVRVCTDGTEINRVWPTCEFEACPVPEPEHELSIPAVIESEVGPTILLGGMKSIVVSNIAPDDVIELCYNVSFEVPNYGTEESCNLASESNGEIVDGLWTFKYNFSFKEIGVWSIWAKVNGKPTNIIDFNVEYTGYEGNRIRITNPNSEDIWQAGETHDITWNSSGFEQVRFKLDCRFIDCDSCGGGYSTGQINDIDSGEEGGSYMFDVPDTWVGELSCTASIQENVPGLLIPSVGGVNTSLVNFLMGK